jgi:hypothetical protein
MLHTHLGIIQNLSRSLIPQTRNLSRTFFNGVYSDWALTELNEGNLGLRGIRQF